MQTILITNDILYKKIVVEDVYVDNLIYNFNFISNDINNDFYKLGAASLGISPQFNQIDRSDLDRKLVEYVKSTVSLLNDYSMWIFVRTEWEYKTKIFEYKKLWKTMQLNYNLDISEFSRSEERLFYYDNKICYAGLLGGSYANLLDAIILARLLSEKSFFIFNKNKDFIKDHNIVDLFNIAYNDEESYSIDWQNISQHFCPDGNIVVRLAPIMDCSLETLNESALDFFGISNIILELAKDFK
jgi:hypothetical protein